MNRGLINIGAMLIAALAAGVTAGAAASSQSAPRAAGTNVCRISGRATSGGTALPGMPLPGVSLVLRDGNRIVTATSTGASGEWDVALPPGTYQLEAELTGFDRIDRTFTVRPESCAQTVDLQMALSARGSRNPGQEADPAPARPTRFDTLTVRSSGVEPDNGAEADESPAATLALPPGFSTETPTDSVAITGSTASVDRGLLNDRKAALGRGEFAVPGPGGPAAAIQGPGGRTGGPGPAPPRFAAGRGRPQRLYSGTGSYTVVGSAFDAAPYQLRPESPASKPDYMRQSMDFTVGGPLKVPGIYDGTRRTNLTLSYSATHGGNVFDQYATVPTEPMRAGDLSSLSTTLVDPSTGQPLPANQIPTPRISPVALALLQYIPLPNVPGTKRNFHETTTTGATQHNVTFRLNQNFTPSAAGRGGGGGPAGGGRGAAGGGGAGRGAATTPNTRMTAALNSQVQYRSFDNERFNVFPSLRGVNTGSTLNVPATLNITHRGVQHSINVNYARSQSETRNRYAFVQNPAAAAGIAGVATDPFDWGVPSLSFGSLSSLNDLTPARRVDTRLSAGYGWSRWIGKQRVRFGGDVRREQSTGQTDANARGAFVFTGLYSGSDFGDFLLGQAQQASVQYGPGTVPLRSRSMSLYAEHEWWYGYFTFNTGVRYELTGPYVGPDGQMANLDIAPGFTAASPVAAGGSGRFSGAFPDALVRTDGNNLMPRLGLAWQPAPGTTLRAGYGVSFNTGSYPAIARQLVSQSPLAVTSTIIGSAQTPLDVPIALTSAGAATTNSYGVALDYQLGRVQTWNVDLGRDLAQVWTVNAGYTHARGSSLDLVRAPNRGPNGLRISGVEPFLWQSSEGTSRLHSATFRLRRRNTRGIGGNLSYTLARSMDDASTVGGGQTVVAQDDQDLAAEWGRSSFDRRHVFSGNVNLELPFGPNRRWLNGGGAWAALLEAWTANVTVTRQSGQPLTARVLSASSEVARGTNGTLRANYNGQPITLDGRSIDRFFNTAAFSIPAAGTFGDSSRNIITGPGNKDLTAQFTRDIRLGGTHALSVQLRASNLLNLVNYAAVDTVVNSPTFGQVTAVRPLRSMQLNLRFRY